MGQIYTYENKKQYATGKPNTVVKGVSLDWRAFQIVRPDGALTVVFAVRFGKDPKTGKPQIAILDFPKISELFVECSKPLYAQLEAAWDVADKPGEEAKLDVSVLEEAMKIDVESLGKATLEEP